MTKKSPKTTSSTPISTPSQGIWGTALGTSQIVRAHSSTSGRSSHIVRQRMNFFRKPR